MDYREYSIQRKSREPLLQFVVDALEQDSCRILQKSEPDKAPFRLTFETPLGERLGIIVYAFLANSRLTKNRPNDEHRFQVKYGPNDKKLHPIWQDPFLLYTTLFCGIDPERGIFVGADPAIHNPTRFFISIEFKEHHVNEILKHGWHSWERDHRAGDDKPIEVLVGGTAATFLRYLRFEREALLEDPGHRQLLAERSSTAKDYADVMNGSEPLALAPSVGRLHSLASEFELTQEEVLDLIANARRLKMAVRGWVAEEHLRREIIHLPGVTECERKDEEGGPDLTLRFEGTPLTIECKNVLRKTNREGLARMDFQRTRASKNDPCSRYYGPGDFNILAACLHAVTEHWQFKYAIPSELDPHPKCRGKLSNNVKIDGRWGDGAVKVLRRAARG